MVASHRSYGKCQITIELEGPKAGCRHGNPMIHLFKAERSQEVSSVSCPVPEGDYSFEDNVLSAFLTYYFNQEMLPDYTNPPGNPFQNSNTFVNYLITSQGGTINTPSDFAYGANAPFWSYPPGQPDCGCK